MSSLILYLDILYKTFLEVGRPSTLKDLVIWTLSLEVLDGVFTFCFVLSTRVSSFSALPQKPDNIYTLRILQQKERKMRRNHVLIFQDCFKQLLSTTLDLSSKVGQKWKWRKTCFVFIFVSKLHSCPFCWFWNLMQSQENLETNQVQPRSESNHIGIIEITIEVALLSLKIGYDNKFSFQTDIADLWFHTVLTSLRSLQLDSQKIHERFTKVQLHASWLDLS